MTRARYDYLEDFIHVIGVKILLVKFLGFRPNVGRSAIASCDDIRHLLRCCSKIIIVTDKSHEVKSTEKRTCKRRLCAERKKNRFVLSNQSNVRLKTKQKHVVFFLCRCVSFPLSGVGTRYYEKYHLDMN